MLRIISPPKIIPYRGYGTSHKIYVKGQVLENRPEFTADEGDKRRRNFRVMLSRYLSTPIPEYPVQVCIGEQTTWTKSDDLGYFSHWIDLDNPLSAGWRSVKFRIYEMEKKEVLYECEAEILIVSDESSFGIISDIDDTVLVSHATQIIKKIRLILTKNAKTRLPFQGVAKFYHAIAQRQNPFFYVSSSEWNLYDFLVDFFQHRNIPKGPFLLQEFKSGIGDLINSGGGSHQHKHDKIERLLELFPFLDFILIGDSGQRDPEIYLDIVKKYPNRILAVYIREIGKISEEDFHLISEFEQYGCPCLMMESSEKALKHARENNLTSS